MEEKEPQKPSTRIALIGLIGTILTACGGLAGALIGGAATIYKAEQDTQKLAIAAPLGDQPLTVDTRQIAISSSQIAKLDPVKNLIYPDLGFVTAQPPDDWNQSGQVSYADLFQEHDTDLSPLIFFFRQIQDTWDDQPVRQFRYAEPLMVQFVEGSTENGLSVDPTQLETDTIAFYSQVTILALDKALAQPTFTLYELALNWGSVHEGGVNSIIANPDSQYVFEQVSWEMNGVRINNQLDDLTLQRWALFAEGADRYYIVELQYVPITGQSTQVWDDLQAYLNAFRIIK